MTIDEVLKSPAGARARASALLADSSLSGPARRDALWMLGKSLLESNEVAGASQVLQLAVAEAGAHADSETRSLILGTLATALAKAGDLRGAHAAIDDAEAHLGGAALGRVLNQRGLLHFESGDFPAAEREFERAAGLLGAGGDVEAETRTLFNLATIASLQGRIHEAESRFLAVRELAERTGQQLLLAGIEGNLGFTVARRADFPRALAHFERARRMFDDIGEAGLSVAVLEFDFAEVLLELGLNREAADAARRSLQSSNAGGNRTQAAQARMQLAIALFATGDAGAAQTELLRAAADFEKAELTGWALRCEYLLASTGDPGLPVDQLDDMALRLAERGWARESSEITLAAALRSLDGGDRLTADRLILRLVGESGTRHRSAAVRPELIHALALRQVLDGRNDLARRTIRKGLRQLAERASVLGSRELQVGVAGRAAALGRLGLLLSLETRRPTEVLLTADLVRALSLTAVRVRPAPSPELSDALTAWRSAQAELDSARLSGAPTATLRTLTARSASCESTIQTLSRHRSSQPGGRRRDLDSSLLKAALTDRTLVEFVISEGRIHAVVATSKHTNLVDLGPLDALRPAVDAHRAFLRRLTGATATTSRSDALHDGARSAASVLDAALMTPLHLPRDGEVIIVPTELLHSIIWASLPSLTPRSFTVAPSATLWLSRSSSPVEPGPPSVGLLGLPGLRLAEHEVLSISGTYLPGVDATVTLNATVSDVLRALAGNDLVHLAGHAGFRSDNPWFSNIRAADGEVSVFDIEELPGAPRLVVVAACEAASARAMAGDELVGTTAALLGVGVGAVVAPHFSVLDDAAEVVMLDFHSTLAGGQSSAEALRHARLLAGERGDATGIATANVFQHFGASWRGFAPRS